MFAYKADWPSMKMRAERGDPAVQYAVGAALMDERALGHVNFKDGLIWIGRAAAQNHTPACFTLGRMAFDADYATKCDVPNKETGFKMLMRAATDKDNPIAEAQYVLALLYFDGGYVTKDNEKGSEFLKLAADAGLQLAKNLQKEMAGGKKKEEEEKQSGEDQDQDEDGDNAQQLTVEVD